MRISKDSFNCQKQRDYLRWHSFNRQKHRIYFHPMQTRSAGLKWPCCLLGEIDVPNKSKRMRWQTTKPACHNSKLDLIHHSVKSTFTCHQIRPINDCGPSFVNLWPSTQGRAPRMQTARFRLRQTPICVWQHSSSEGRSRITRLGVCCRSFSFLSLEMARI